MVIFNSYVRLPQGIPSGDQWSIMAMEHALSIDDVKNIKPPCKKKDFPLPGLMTKWWLVD